MGWKEREAPAQVVGEHYQSSNSVGSWANWSFASLTPGEYEVFVNWPRLPVGDAAWARYTAFDGTVATGGNLGTYDVLQGGQVNDLVLPATTDGDPIGWKQLFGLGQSIIVNSGTLTVQLARKPGETDGLLLADAVVIRRVDEKRDVYTWDHRNRLTEVASFNGDVQYRNIRHDYDAFDQRIATYVDTSAPFDMANAKAEYYHLQDGHEKLVFDNDGKLQNVRMFGSAVDQILADEVHPGGDNGPPSTVLWPAADRLGSVRGMVASDAVADTTPEYHPHYDYEPFGQAIQRTKPLNVPLATDPSGYTLPFAFSVGGKSCSTISAPMPYCGAAIQARQKARPIARSLSRSRLISLPQKTSCIMPRRFRMPHRR